MGRNDELASGCEYELTTARAQACQYLQYVSSRSHLVPVTIVLVAGRRRSGSRSSWTAPGAR